MLSQKTPNLFLMFSMALLLLSGCVGDEPKRVPSTLPDVHGYVSDIKRTAKDDALKVIVQVKAMEGIEADYPEARIRMDESTLLENTDGEELTLALLREGHEVMVWYEGGILETGSPMEGFAKAVRVID